LSISFSAWVDSIEKGGAAQEKNNNNNAIYFTNLLDQRNAAGDNLRLSHAEIWRVNKKTRLSAGL
jgi:hypothetical protein